eukprot:CAMPEP_0179242584 /NCGR_PEP_ID=MMETSP0797-20121207/17092_1 /TAXON_ID=47934 /ORGANISM="Dinophysis acuminata, Strain DAEP01" /LENGTH=400 /DNA_ID=CAMNT_0020950023 /DNA_START=46 /DNA_END=1245 /DNA_ORIENTATION=-
MVWLEAESQYGTPRGGSASSMSHIEPPPTPLNTTMGSSTTGAPPLLDRQARPHTLGGKRRTPSLHSSRDYEVEPREAAARRMDELQDIFVSDNPDKTEALQNRLAHLDEMVAWLKSQVASLEQELLDATVTRTTLPADERAPAADDKTKSEVVQKLYDDEVVKPLLQRKRTIAKVREATQVHTSFLSRLKDEQKHLEDRIYKQQAWMRQLDKQILEAEIEKARCSVRVETVERRTKDLGGKLSQAYENMSKLLEERVGVEDREARNDALVMYLNVIGRADLENEANFTMNRTDVLALLDRCERTRDCEAKLNEAMDKVRNRQRCATDIALQADKIEELGTRLKILWNKIPTTLKQLACCKVQTAGHRLRDGPDAALEQLFAAASAIGEAHRESAEALAAV